MEEQPPERSWSRAASYQPEEREEALQPAGRSLRASSMFGSIIFRLMVRTLMIGTIMIQSKAVWNIIIRLHRPFTW
jgi:hypothetical protein